MSSPALAGASPKSEDLVGYLTLVTDKIGSTGLTCWGTDDHADISRGAAVIVVDEHGTVVARSQLGPGQLVNSEQCRFAFTGMIPVGRPIGVQVTHGRAAQFTVDQVAAGDVEFTIGDR